MLRSFTRWLQQFEPRTEVPDDAIFGRLPERQAPHIYSEQRDRRSAGRRAAARADAGSARRRLRDAVRSDRLHRAADLRGAVAAQRGRRSQVRHAHHSPDQVRQVAPGAHAPEYRGGAASLSLDARPGGRVCAGRRRVLRRHARPTAGIATGRHARCIASSPACASSWAGATAALTTPRASTICGTPSSSAASCCGTPRAWTSIRRCCRCRPTSGMRW